MGETALTARQPGEKLGSLGGLQPTMGPKEGAGLGDGKTGNLSVAKLPPAFVEESDQGGEPKPAPRGEEEPILSNHPVF